MSTRPGTLAQGATHRATRRLRHQLGLDHLPDDAVGLFVPMVDDVSGLITVVIQENVRAYAGPAGGRRRALIASAVEAAVRQFSDIVDNAKTEPGAVNQIFARLGREEAAAERDLDAMRAAFGIAKDEAERALCSVSARHLAAEAQVMLRDALGAYMQALMTVVDDAYRAEARRLGTEPRRLRRRLLELLLAGADSADVAEAASRLKWELPAAVVVCCVDVDARTVSGRQLPDRTLARMRNGRVTVLAPADLEDTLREELESWPQRGPVAVTWAVPLMQAHHAAGWGHRLLELAAEGRVPASPTVHCNDVSPVLLQRIDPLLRQHADELLARLDVLPKEYRRALCRTLHRDLVTQQRSAKRIAADLGTHVNTVTNHRKVLRDFFGDVLDDPASVTALILALPEEIGLVAAPAAVR